LVIKKRSFLAYLSINRYLKLLIIKQIVFKTIKKQKKALN
jgi:hypothetical protein